MRWNDHSRFNGSHAFLSPSSPSWIRYDEEKMKTAKQIEYDRICGTAIHALASGLIEKKLKIDDDVKLMIFYECMNSGLPKDCINVNRYAETLIPYVNDSIHNDMRSEQLLYYDSKCYGTADAISFDDNKLRIHDLKTGVVPAKMEQLYIYASLFFLEYDIDVVNVDIELRIYQNGSILIEKPTINQILPYIDGIRTRVEWLYKYEENYNV